MSNAPQAVMPTPAQHTKANQPNDPCQIACNSASTPMTKKKGNKTACFNMCGQEVMNDLSPGTDYIGVYS